MSTKTTTTMRAVVLHNPGPASNLRLETRPVPTATAGYVLIRIKAFGLNRSELFTRQGHSPNVAFPRILGIECIGVVESCPGGEFNEGATVLTVSYMYPSLITTVMSVLMHGCSVWAASAATSTAATPSSRSFLRTRSKLLASSRN